MGDEQHDELRRREEETHGVTVKGILSLVGKVVLFGYMLHSMPMTHGQASSLFRDAEDAADAQWVGLPPLNSVYYCRDFSESKQMAEDEDGYFFCDGYVDYAAACNANDETSCNNRFAINMFNNFQRALNVYSCGTYSQIWTCANCSDSYKRWVCSQVYHKMYLPGTDRTEEGWVGGFDFSQQDATRDPPEHFSYTTSCANLVAETQEVQIRLCNGWASRPVEELIAEPEQVCGGSANCNGNVFLDPATSSSEDGFYVGSKIQMISGSAIGQWAEIEVYDGSNRIAMFSEWQLPEGQTEGAVPPGNDKYRIFLADNVRGRCRDSRSPLRRQGKACELNEYTDGTDTLQYLPNKYMGGARCGETEQCFPVPKVNTARHDPNGFPIQPDTGYACCPKDSRSLTTLRTQEFKLYSLNTTNLTDGTQNHTCIERRGISAELAASAAGRDVGEAAPAVPAYHVSGCNFNFSVSSDVAFDFCVLKTCFPVCFEVMRRCPVQLDFNCPHPNDKREYDYATCNIMLAQGCSMKLHNQELCTDLNLHGYGPTYSEGMSLFGLPPGATCLHPPNVGVVGIEPPQEEPADGEKANRNVFWEDNGDGVRRFAPTGATKNQVICNKKQ